MVGQGHPGHGVFLKSMSRKITTQGFTNAVITTEDQGWENAGIYE